ncbi:MAG: carboxypeptidase regulatory-like domain-containing protein [Clostridium sp.]
MAQVKKDKYILGQSPSGDIINKGQNIRLDLRLKAATTTIGATVQGKVTDTSNRPISGALVKIMDSSFNPLLHVITDSNGNYVFTSVPEASSYNIFAIAEGTKLQQAQSFSINQGQTITRDFQLVTDPAMSLGIIAGDLFETGSDIPIGGAVVSLYSSVNGVDTLFAVTYTNEYGQYAFREIPIGNYNIKINALGYISSTVPKAVTSQAQIVPVISTLSADPNASKGTISGVILDDDTQQPVNRADVILYRVNADNSLSPVAFTKTNTNGVYLFINVPQGKYKVKSNLIEVVEIVPPTTGIVPSVNTLTLAQAASTYPISVNASSGTLSGGASVDPITGFVNGIGGSSSGTDTLTVNVPFDGKYTVALTYINPSTTKPLKIDVNGVSTGLTYSIPRTNGTTLADALSYTINLNLQKGSNTVKLYGDGASAAPSIGKVTFRAGAYTGNVDTASSNLSGSASINPTTGFVTGVGTIGSGSAEFSINAPLGGVYRLGISYLSPVTSRTFGIQVNGTSTGTIYSAPLTAGATVGDASILNANITLISGNNTVKIVGNGTNAAPDLGSVTFTQIQLVDATPAANATLSGSASVSGDFVINLGGVGNGTLTLNKTVPYTGLYDFAIKYVATDSAGINIFVNGSSGNSPYSFDKTTTTNLLDAQVKVVQINLTAGNNTIKLG